MTALSNTALAGAIRAVERLPLPDTVLSAAVASVVGRNTFPSEPSPQADAAFAAAMRAMPIVVHAAEANQQHYEIPAEFFGLALGPRRKYSCCYYDRETSTLADAERMALEISAEHARLADGQRILELGCGWGSLSLFMAERFPNAVITAVSNSHSQRRYIEGVARTRGLRNLTVITTDVAHFEPQGPFDRIVSIEMLEHVANWSVLFKRLAASLAPDGRTFIHVFAHRSRAYRFDHQDPTDWIGQHFFTGGLMPSEGLIRQFPEILMVEDEWRWSGDHYARTARDWLSNLDQNADQALAVLRPVYGRDTKLWFRRWRLFFLAVEGLFAHRGGAEWGVKQYLLRRG